jgi:hypothetical protein
MHLLRLVVPAVALALALPVGAVAQSPAPTVPLYVTSNVLHGLVIGCCEYELTTRHEDRAPVTTRLAWSADGARLVAPDGLRVPAGPLTIRLEAWYVSDVVKNGQQDRLGPAAVCELVTEVPASGMELTLVTTERACLLEAAPSERRGPGDPPDPVSSLLALHPLPAGVDLAGALPPFVTIAPSSAAGSTAGMPFTTALGHCGLFSPLDVDGALWDPIGGVDADLGPIDAEDELGELINATEVEALLVSPDRLDLRTPLGTVVVLARHQGPGEYPGCD